MTQESTELLAPEPQAGDGLGSFMTMAVNETGVKPTNMAEVWGLAQMILKGGLAPKGDNMQAVAIKIALGIEVGLSFMSAVANICVINGRPGMFGDMPLAIVRGAGVLEEFSETIVGPDGEDSKLGEDGPDDFGYLCKAKRKGTDEYREQLFTVAMAKRAKLWKKEGPWTTYPERQIMWRARTWVLRDLFSDILKGFRPAEELIDTPDERDITAQVTVSEPVGSEKRAKPIIDPEKSLSDQFDITDRGLDKLHIDVLRAVATAEGVEIDTSKMRTPGVSAAIKLHRAEKRAQASEPEPIAGAETETECAHGVGLEYACFDCGRQPKGDPADF